MDHEVAKEVMLECDDILRTFNLDHFLIMGTALGAYRDNGFTPSERDIDFGFLAERFVPAAEDVASAFEAAGFKAMRVEVPLTRVRAIKLDKRGIHVDLVAYMLWQEQRLVPNADPKVESYALVYPSGILEAPYESVSLFGRVWKVPSPIEEYLENEYGDWKTPRSDHVSRTRVYGFMKDVPHDLLET